MGGANNVGTVMTLTNSIIGVSVLAMPFCFKQCGIFLSIVMLILSSMVSRLACHFLLKAAQMARRRNFEFLAFQTFGPMGKFLVELCIIGFLMGTCIAFFVVMGDLGPVIIAKTLNIGSSAALRPSVLIGVGLFVVIPLGLLRNVDSLSSICTASVVFYICFVLKVVVESLPHLLEGDWVNNVHYWKPSGVMQCIPIFSMALFCQTQLFEIYESIPNASLEQMNEVIRKAVNICTFVYISVGFFGYVAFCTQNFSGNVLLSFSPSLVSDVIKLGFVMSVAVSFPLTIFPCRASIYSLLFRRVQMSHHDGVSSHIPETRFKCITLFVVSFALAVGLLVPSIELVLGLVGSTIGVLICIMFPAVAFIRINTKSSYDRLLAQVVLFVGVLILVLGTYATLYASNDVSTQLQVKQDHRPDDVKLEVPNVVMDVNLQMNKNKPRDIAAEVKKALSPSVVGVVPSVAQEVEKAVENIVLPEAESKNVRQEPPVPVEPAAVPVQATKAPANKQEPTPPPEMKLRVEKKVTVEQVIHQDAIKKEEEALAEAGANGRGEAEPNKKQVELLLKLEEHKEEQKKLLQEQQEILQQLNKHKEDLERNRQRQQQEKAVPAASSPLATSEKPKPAVPSVRPNILTENVAGGLPHVLQDQPAQLKTQVSNNSVVKPLSIIPLPLAVQDNSRLLDKALQQVAQNHMTKENVSLGMEQRETKVTQSKESQPIAVEQKEGKAKETVVQRDILSNVGLSHERDKRDVEEQLATDERISKNNSGQHDERYCDTGQNKTIAEKMIADVSVASHGPVLSKMENLNVSGDSKFHSDKDNNILQQNAVTKNITVLIGDVKESQQAYNATLSKAVGMEVKNMTKTNESSSESIIKMAPYLSVQPFDGTIEGLVKENVMADGWKQSETLVKPMSRDLKSVASQQLMHDNINSSKRLEILNDSVSVNSARGQQLLNDVGNDVPRQMEAEVEAMSQNFTYVIGQNSVNNVNVDAPKQSEAPTALKQQSVHDSMKTELQKQSEMLVKPMSRDLKSVPALEANDIKMFWLK